MTPIPRDVDSIENIHGLFEVKLSQGSVALRPDPNPWKEAVRKSNAADPSPRPARRPTFTLFDEPEITPENTAAADNNNWWRWLFVGDLRFVDVGKSVILNDTCLVAWRVAIFALSLAAAIVTGIFAPQPEAFLLPVSHALLAAISPRLIYLAAKKPIDDETTPKFQYRYVYRFYRIYPIFGSYTNSSILYTA